MDLAAYRTILRRLGVESADADRPEPPELGRLLDMTLHVFAREGQPVELGVAWWPATLFLVPDVRHAETLWREGIGRERIWTARELSTLLQGAPWTLEDLRMVTVARREFGGEVLTVAAPGGPG